MLAVLLNGSAVVALVGVCIAAAAALGGVFASSAYKNSAEAAKNAAEGWKEERDAAVAKADRLEGLVTDLQQKVESLQVEVDSLRAKDVSKLYDLMNEFHIEMVNGASALQQRDAELLGLVQKIAEKIA